MSDPRHGISYIIIIQSRLPHVRLNHGPAHKYLSQQVSWYLVSYSVSSSSRRFTTKLLCRSDKDFFLPTLSGPSPQSNTMTGLMTSPVCLQESRSTEFFQLATAPSCISDSHGMYGLIELGQLVKPGHLVYRKLAFVVHGDQTGKRLP